MFAIRFRNIPRVFQASQVRGFKKTIQDLVRDNPKAVENVNVFLRVDFNVPLDKKSGKITDDTRIVESLPTINFLRKNGAKVILASHCGRPDGKVNEKMRMAPMAVRLGELISSPVQCVDESVGPNVDAAISNLRKGDVLMLENVRFHAEEEKNNDDYSRALAKNIGVYVNDAFGTAHRAHSSTAGVAKFVPVRVAGLLMEKEIRFLKSAVDTPVRPFAAIVGGAKISTKIPVLEALLKKCDKVFVGGGLRYTFYKAMGHNVGTSLIEEDYVPMAIQLLKTAKERGVKFILPIDSVIADKFGADVNTQIVDIDKMPDGWMGMDMGPKSIKLFCDELSTCKTIVWNGPMGVFEFEKFSNGTFSLCRHMAEMTTHGTTTIIGGGDVVAAVHAAKLDNAMTHISTGGGASLEMLEGKDLPGVAALDNAI
jgi:phosphoglycerate kinase